MATLPLVETDVPFWLGGDSTLSVDVASSNPKKPIPDNTKELVRGAVEEVFEAEWLQQQAARLQFQPISSPIADLKPPTHATLNQFELRILDKLFAVQETLIHAIGDLSELVNEKKKLPSA